MWLFTIYGFFSVACVVRRDGTLDTSSVAIRARCYDHLKNLCIRFSLRQKIHRTPEADYRYRITMSKAKWARLTAKLAAEQTWSNFKAEAQLWEREVGWEYVASLHAVWYEMYHLQAASNPGRLLPFDDRRLGPLQGLSSRPVGKPPAEARKTLQRPAKDLPEG